MSDAVDCTNLYGIIPSHAPAKPIFSARLLEQVPPHPTGTLRHLELSRTEALNLAAWLLISVELADLTSVIQGGADGRPADGADVVDEVRRVVEAIQRR